MSQEDSINDLTRRIREFAAERDWDQFHTPKNLAMALAGEAGELLAEFQWLTPEQSLELESDKFAAVKDEMADVLIYLIRLGDVLGIDPIEAVNHKMTKNQDRYSVEKSLGNADKQ